MPKIIGEPKQQMTIRIAAETFKNLEQREKQTHLSKSVIIQIALDKFFEQTESGTGK